MKKPTPKKEVAIDVASENARMILFYATKDAVTEFKEFGAITEESSGIPNLYTLWVDARFDFNEVKTYIENYG